MFEDNPMLRAKHYSEQIHAALGPLIPPGAPLVLLDFPKYSNVGDSAIWLGELAYLRRYQRRSRLLWTADADLMNWPVLPVLPPDAVILLHGGGNFGDLWPYHQQHREYILRQYPQHRIIQLPQTLYFQDAANQDRCRQVLRDHPDFHLLVRDEASLALAADLRHGDVALCPDMALCLDNLPRRRPVHDMVTLLRNDKERRPEPASPLPDGVILTDWPTVDTPFYAHRLDDWLARHRQTLRCVQPYVHYLLARRRLHVGCQLLTAGRVVITDRLHGHILCTLLGIPHVVLDTAYGKISHFRERWQTGTTLCQAATTRAEAFAKAQALLTRC